MKAAVCSRYGPPEVIHIEDVAKPVPKDHEVLIEVRSAAVNPLDGALMKGRPYIARIMTGLRKPKITRLGVDVAGQVEAVGRNVTQFKPGDEISFVPAKECPRVQVSNLMAFEAMITQNCDGYHRKPVRTDILISRPRARSGRPISPTPEFLCPINNDYQTMQGWP